jgi:hypothetical protein
MIKTKENLQIEFLSQYNHTGYFLFDVKLTNTGSKKIDYDMSKLRSNAGRSVLLTNPNYKIEGIELLSKGTLKKDESIEGLVCLIPSSFICTDSPKFYFEGEKFKVHLKKVYKEKLKQGV